MSQQQFEPREGYEHADDENYQASDAYSRAGQFQEGQPKDEPPGAYGVPAEQDRQSSYQSGQSDSARVPWWARPQRQPQQGTRVALTTFIVALVLVVVLMGGLGIAGVVLGNLLHLLGVLLSAIVTLLIVLFLLIVLIVFMVWRAIARAMGYDPRAQRRLWREQQRAARRYARDARRAARRAGRWP